MKRLTITPVVIKKAKHVILMVAGKEKASILRKAFDDPKNVYSLPESLTFGRTWVLNKEAAIAFRNFGITNKYNTRIIYGS